MLTSSFGWTSSPARVAITSFAFMFDEVPEPVWKTSMGNWSSSSPSAIRAEAAEIRSALSASSRPRSAFARAAAPLMRPSQRATGTGIGSPETGKFTTAFVVSPPQSSCRSSVFAIKASVGKEARASEQELRDRREPALGERALARGALLCLGHLEHGSPAEVAALRTLRGLEVLEAVTPRNAARAALEAFDYEGVHARSIGGSG